MRDYAKFAPTFWTRGSGKQLRGCPEAQIVAAYLFTAPGSNMIGLYYLPIPTLAHETGLGLEGASKGLRRVCEVGIAHYDPEAELVWLPEGARIQIGAELSDGDKRAKGVVRELEQYGKHPYIQAFLDKYGKTFGLQLDGAEASPLEGAWKGLRSQDQDQEQDHAQEQDGSAQFSGIEAPSLPEPPDPPPESAPAAPRTKPAKVPPQREPKAHERYAEAYAAGMREASGQPFSQPRGKADLVEMATTYARIPGGAALVGAELLSWFRETAAAYRLACPNGQFQGGYDPAHCLRWLNAGRPDDRGRAFGRPSMRQPPAASEPAWTPQDGSQARAILNATEEEWAAMCAAESGGVR